MKNRISNSRLDEIMARCDAATPGPWKVMGVEDHIIGNDFEEATRFGVKHCQWTHNTTKENAEFISESRTDIPDLIAEIRELWNEIEYLRSMNDI